MQTSINTGLNVLLIKLLHRSSLFLARPILSENDLATPPDRRVIQAVEDLQGTQIIASGMSTCFRSLAIGVLYCTVLNLVFIYFKQTLHLQQAFHFL
jgi:hypothetical protein